MENRILKEDDIMLAVDSEATGLFVHKGCRAFIFSATDGEDVFLWKFPVDPYTRKVQYNNKTLSDFKRTLDSHEDLIFHHANFDIQILESIGISCRNHNIHDTMVLSHAFKSDGKHGLKDLALLYLDYPDDDEEELGKAVKKLNRQATKFGWKIYNKKNPPSSLVGIQKEGWRSDYWLPAAYAKYRQYEADHPYHTVCDKYALADAERTYGVFQVLYNACTPNQKVAYHEARKLIYPILDMEMEGVPIKEESLRAADKKYTAKFNAKLKEMRDLVGDQSFKPTSPKQLSNVLFNKYKFPVVKNAKNGPSTDKHVIQKLLENCDIRLRKYKFLLNLLEIRKIITTRQYLNNYNRHAIIRTPDIAFPHTNDRVRTLQALFKQCATGTSRLGCENPNQTNVGKDNADNPFSRMPHLGVTEDSSFKLREVFGPMEGDQWTCIDYDQFQLRIFAVVSGSNTLLRAFENGEDAHHAVARVLFKSDDISDVQRTAAKAINFGLIFGAGPKKIELLAGMPGLYSLFLSQFPSAKQFLSKQESLASRKGYVHTVNGYRLYVPKDRPYAAACYVIQGTEAQIVRRAMVKTHEYTRQKHLSEAIIRGVQQRVLNECPYRLIMMVHDELVFRSPVIGDNPYLPEIMRIMEDCGNQMGIPSKVDAKVTTTNWADRKAI